jgi:hypothetical protein
MKWNFLGALALSTALASQSFGHGMLDRMLGSGCGCGCEPSCSCCEKSCCAEQSCCGCENGCGSGCCNDGCGFFDGLFGLFDCGGCGCGNGCCEPSCCCESGCVGNGCSNGTYHHEGGVQQSDESAPAAPAEAGASIRPIPPRPMADPSAKVARQRNVVRTSFVR